MCRKEPGTHMEAHVLEAAHGISSRLDSTSPPLHILHNLWVRFLGYVCVGPHLVQEHPTPTIWLCAKSHVPGVPARFGCWRGASVHPAFPHASMVLSRSWRTLAITELLAHDYCHIDQCVCSGAPLHKGMITQPCNYSQNWKVTQMRAATLHYVKVPMLICSYDLVICRKNAYLVRWVILLFTLACQVIQALCMPRRA